MKKIFSEALNRLIDQAYPSRANPGLFTGSVQMSEMIKEIKEKQQSFMQTDSEEKSSGSPSNNLEIIAIIDKYIPVMIEIDLKVILKFFSLFPEYLFKLQEANYQSLLPLVADKMQEILYLQLIKREDNEVPKFFYELITVLPQAKLPKLAKHYLDKLLTIDARPRTFEGDPYAPHECYPRYPDGLGSAVVALSDYLDEDDLNKFTNYLTALISIEYGLPQIADHLASIIPKLRPTKLTELITLLNVNPHNPMHSSYRDNIISAFKNCYVEGKPIILDDIILQVFMKDFNTSSLESFVELRFHFSKPVIEGIFNRLLAGNRFEILSKIFDVLSTPQRVAVTNHYLNWIDLNYNTVSINHYSSAMLVFKDYFDASYRIYLNKCIISAFDNLEFASNARYKFLPLSGLIPEIFQKKIVAIIINLLNSKKKVDPIIFRILLANLDVCTQKEVEAFSGTIFKYVEDNIFDLTTADLVRLKKHASNESYWQNVLKKLLVETFGDSPGKDMDELQKSFERMHFTSEYLSKYVAIASLSKIDSVTALIQKYLLAKMKQDITEVNFSLFGWIIKPTNEISNISKNLINNTFALFLKELDHKKVDLFSKAVEQIQNLNQKIDSAIFRKLIITSLYEFYIRVTSWHVEDQGQYPVLIYKAIVDIQQAEVEDILLVTANKVVNDELSRINAVNKAIIQGVPALHYTSNSTTAELQKIYLQKAYKYNVEWLLKVIEVGDSESRKKAFLILLPFFNLDNAVSSGFVKIVPSLLNKQAPHEHKFFLTNLVNKFKGLTVGEFSIFGSGIKVAVQLYMAHFNNLITLQEIAALALENQNILFLKTYHATLTKTAILDAVETFPEDMTNVVMQYRYG